MTYPPPPAELLAAARYELERRRESYPAQVLDGRKDPDQATRDFQGWAGVVEWLETGHCNLIGLVGGVDTENPRTIEWGDLQGSVDQGLAALRRLYRDESAYAADPVDDARRPLDAAQLAALEQRGRTLAQIQDRLNRHVALRDALNAELRALVSERKAA